MVATVHHQKENGLPCQVVEIGVMMDLELGSAELRLCSGIFCPTVSDVCHRAVYISCGCGCCYTVAVEAAVSA